MLAIVYEDTGLGWTKSASPPTPPLTELSQKHVSPLRPRDCYTEQTPACSSLFEWPVTGGTSLVHPHRWQQGFPEPPHYNTLFPHHPSTHNKRFLLPTLPPSLTLYEIVEGLSSHYFQFPYFPDRKRFFVELEGSNFIPSGYNQKTELQSRLNKPQNRLCEFCVSCLPFWVSVLSPDQRGWSAGIHSFPFSRESNLMQSPKLPHCIPTAKHHQKVGLQELCPKAANDWKVKSINSSK